TKEKSWYYMQLPLGYSVLAGSLTLMLVVLPVVIISSQEALRAVPSSLRDGGLGMGCTPWQVVWNITLPSATPGIMTGSILAMSRAMGEAAPILLVSSALYVSNVPSSLMSRYTIMPLQIYQWADDHNRDFYSLAATGIIVLLVVLLIFNSIAVFVRQRSQKKIR
ncbi:MAG: ABC transporter permease subunit, partial [Pirellulaceae bacterium]|nr:ABC transporter permease subunit [Pirellulaceae bacterium]